MYWCHKCGRKHHTSLCNDSSNDNVTQAPPSAQPPVPTTQTTMNIDNTNPTASFTDLAHPPSHMFAKDNTCLLKTAVTTITSSSLMESEANILFDLGSQHSFLSQELAEF